MSHLLFIDTNVLLDFYRHRNESGLHLLRLIEQHHDRIITSYQVDMEFKKNRQRVILESLKELKKPDVRVSTPAFLKKAKSVSAMRKSLSDVTKWMSDLQTRAKKLLLNPTTHDPVYQGAQRLFKNPCDLNLRRENEIKHKVRRLARRRFVLGYPPRKDQDTSIGDAVNWEWMLHCIQVSKANLIIASRDKDYGVTVDGCSYLNDWLLQEFRARGGRGRQVLLTDRLTEAFKRMAIKVTEQDEKEEQQLLASKEDDWFLQEKPPSWDDFKSWDIFKKDAASMNADAAADGKQL